MSHTPTHSHEYVRLAAIRVSPVQGSCEIHLICEDDECACAFRARCSSLAAFYLRPYADWLREYREGQCVDQPIIPIFRSHGDSVFDTWTAARDHPELAEELSQFLNAGCTPSSEALGAALVDLS